MTLRSVSLQVDAGHHTFRCYTAAISFVYVDDGLSCRTNKLGIQRYANAAIPNQKRLDVDVDGQSLFRLVVVFTAASSVDKLDQR